VKLDKQGSLEGAARFRETRRVTAWGLVGNLMLSGVKITGGAVWGSRALVADGVNSISDCVSDIAILIGAVFWSKPSDDTHPHGHARIETMVAGFVGLLIVATGAMLAWESFDAAINPAQHEVGWMVFIIAVASVISKEALYRWTIRKSRQLRSPALAAKAWDHRSDCLSSIPVALVVIAIRISPSLDHLDGIAGGVVAVFILRTGIRILKPALWQLTDSAAPVEVREELLSIARGVPGVLDIHDLRTRYQGEGVQADMHIVVEADLPLIKAFAIAAEVERRLRSSGTGVVDALVRLEPDRQE
jgi:cation diffusion facilitator family transporter